MVQVLEAPLLLMTEMVEEAKETAEVTGEGGYLIQMQQKWQLRGCMSIVC